MTGAAPMFNQPSRAVVSDAVSGAAGLIVDRQELELGQFIPLHYHFAMLDDTVRTGAFEAAIDAVVPSGSRVLELGGGTGILSFFAARRAARVWCVERDPELAAVASRLLQENGADSVEVITADARAYVPAEPVDVVICEMLHVGLLREKQIEVLAAFASNYAKRHGAPLPRFLPEAVIQAVQPVEQGYTFRGYRAPTARFQDATASHPRTEELGEPAVYQTLLYEDKLPQRIAWQGRLAVAQPGHLNALRFITKNLLAILPSESRSIDWLMNYLVVPLEQPLPVHAGDTIEVSFDYHAGGPIKALAPHARLL